MNSTRLAIIFLATTASTSLQCADNGNNNQSKELKEAYRKILLRPAPLRKGDVEEPIEKFEKGDLCIIYNHNYNDTAQYAIVISGGWVKVDNGLRFVEKAIIVPPQDEIRLIQEAKVE